MERNPDAKLQNLDAMPGNPDVEERSRRRSSGRGGGVSRIVSEINRRTVGEITTRLSSSGRTVGEMTTQLSANDKLSAE